MHAIARWVLAAGLAFAGVMHFVAFDTFLLLVPSWLPGPGPIVLFTGVMEVGFAVALVLAPAGRWRRMVGLVLTAFLVVVFVGNVSQALSGVDAFGLDTDAERRARLAFQPLLIAWAIWATGPRGRSPMSSPSWRDRKPPRRV